MHTRPSHTHPAVHDRSRINLWVMRGTYVAIACIFIGGWILTYRTLQPRSSFLAFNHVSASTSSGTPGPSATALTPGHVASDVLGAGAPAGGIAVYSTAEPTPTATASETPEPSATPTPAGTTYTIKSGDTLGGIAKSHGETVERLATANRLKPPYALRAGDHLLIPAH